MGDAVAVALIRVWQCIAYCSRDSHDWMTLEVLPGDTHGDRCYWVNRCYGCRRVRIVTPRRVVIEK